MPPLLSSPRRPAPSRFPAMGLLEACFAHTSVGMAVWTVQDGIVYANDALHDLLFARAVEPSPPLTTFETQNYISGSPEDAMKNLLDITHEDDYSAYVKNIQRISRTAAEAGPSRCAKASGQHNFSTEKRYWTKGGACIWVREHVTAINVGCSQSTHETHMNGIHGQQNVPPIWQPSFSSKRHRATSSSSTPHTAPLTPPSSSLFSSDHTHLNNSEEAFASFSATEDSSVVLYSVLKDVTEEKRRQAELEDRKHKLAMCLDLAQVGAWDWNLDTDEVYWDENMRRLMGSRETIKLARDKAFTYFNKDDLRNTMPGIMKSIESMKDYSTEVRMPVEGAKSKYIVSWGRPLPSESGNGGAKSVIGISMDVTKLKEAELKWKNIADSIPHLVQIVSAQTGLSAYHNKSWLDFFGGTEEGWMGSSSWLNLIHPEEKAGYEEWRRTILSSEIPKTREHRFWDRQLLKYRWFLSCLTPMRNEDNIIDHWIGTWTNIDDLKETQELLLEARRNLEREEADTGVTAAAMLQDSMRETDGDVVLPDVAEMTEEVAPYVDKSAGRSGTSRLSPSNTVPGKQQPEKIQDLKQSLLEQVLNSLPIIVFTATPNGIVDFLNNRFYWMTNTRREDNPDPWQQVSAEDLPGLSKTWMESMETGQPFLSYYRLRDREPGCSRWFLSKCLPVKDDYGRILRWYGTSTDIHDLKMAQIELIAMQKRTEAVVESCGAIIWAVDRDGIYTFYKGRQALAAGFDPLAMIGTKVTGLASEGDIQRALSGETFAYISEVRGCIFSNHLSPAHDAQGKTEGVFGVSINITEKQKHEDQLRKFEQMFQYSPCGMAICSVDNKRFIHVNNMFAKMHGTDSTSYWVGKEVISMFTKEERNMFDALVKDLETDGFISYESMHQRVDGTEFPTITTTSLIKDWNGKVYALGTFMDITHAKQLEKEKTRLLAEEHAARTASDLKSQFLANMSHEIRTPLNGVIGMIDLAYDSVSHPDVKHQLSIAKSSAESLLAIVTDILDLSKIEAGKVDMKLSSFDVVTMVRDVIEMHTLAASAKGLALTCKIEDDKYDAEKRFAGEGRTDTGGRGRQFPVPPKSRIICADHGRVQQILINLISNGIKFTQSGSISVSCRFLAQGNILRFEVKDSGIGLADSAMGRLFKPFSQVDASTTRKFGGTGLGLAISKQLVTLMGGEMGVTSSPGEGSTFWFTIQYQIPENVSSAPFLPGRVDEPVSLQTMSNGRRSLKILIVEDNHVNQLVIQKMVERLGHTALIAENGEIAVTKVHQEKFDVVFMDCHMPVMDGYMATKLIRQSTSERVSKIPIIAMTARAFKDEKERCLACGMDEFVSKPVTKDRLIKVLETLSIK